MKIRLITNINSGIMAAAINDLEKNRIDAIRIGDYQLNRKVCEFKNGNFNASKAIRLITQMSCQE